MTPIVCVTLFLPFRHGRDEILQVLPNLINLVISGLGVTSSFDEVGIVIVLLSAPSLFSLYQKGTISHLAISSLSCLIDNQHRGLSAPFHISFNY